MSLKTGTTTDNNIIIITQRTVPIIIVHKTQQCESPNAHYIMHIYNDILRSRTMQHTYGPMYITTEPQRSTRAHYFCALLRLVKRKSKT